MRKVLYVDDDAINLALFELQFQNHFEVHVCQEPQDAVEKIVEQSIPVLVSDCKMPGMNGMELIQEVKRVAPHTTCIMLSGYLKNDLKLNHKLINSFVSKPFDFDYLLKVIDDAFVALERPANV